MSLSFRRRATLCAAFLLLAAACAPVRGVPARIQVGVLADGKEQQVEVASGSTVQQVLDKARISLSELDRVEPPLYTVVGEKDTLRIVRVEEKFEIEQRVLPFDQQVLKNESLPKDRQVYLQRGKNGLVENTIRLVFEDGLEASRSVIKSVRVQEPVAEILMIGVQAPFFPIAIPGRLMYLRDGSAWLIEQSTGNRRAIVTTGDLDGYIFSLSSDASWLLFTRKSQEENQINTLWAAQVDGEPDTLVDLKTANVIYFADWLPGSNSHVVLSTVEAQSAAPGWRANNDFKYITIFKSLQPKIEEIEMQASLNGVYPFWGVSFTWSPKDTQLAYANDHSAGLLEVTRTASSITTGASTPLLEFAPYKTYSSWAWVPGISWSPDGKMLFTIDHASTNTTAAAEESPLFDLVAIPVDEGTPLRLVSQVGMFAYPLASPGEIRPSGEAAYSVAFLQAISPQQSETSRYQLVVMDRDGSNRKTLFPEPGAQGLEPQREWGAWSPQPLPDSGNAALALIHDGNLWLVDAVSGQVQQITGDNLTRRVAWGITE